MPPQPELDALRERIEEHEQVIEGVFRNSRLMAEQVAALGLQVQQLADDVRHLRDDLPAKLMESAIAIVGNPAVWEAGRKAMASQARNAAGGVVLGWLGALLRHPVATVMTILVLYQLGGWHAVVAWFKSQ